MNVEVRKINGVRGFCIYKGGIPYTYIDTRDAIKMIGLVKVQNGYTKLRIDRFGEYFTNIMQDEMISIQPVQIGITLTPNYKISIGGFGPTSGTSIYTGHVIQNNSKYDSILPEFILDRIIFAIANILNNNTAKKFRFELFNTIIPYFQQTATQDQIAKVPILNQTSQFMYDNTNVQFTAQQAYNFNKNIVFQYVNRYAILIGQTNIMNVFENLFTDFEYALNNAGIYIQDEIMKIVEARKAVNPYSSDHITKEDIIDTVICNLKMHNLFTTFVANYIRGKENEILLKRNGQVVKEEWNQNTGCYEPEIKYEDDVRLHPVRFITMDERAGLNPLQEETLKDYIPNAKRDTSWIY